MKKKINSVCEGKQYFTRINVWMNGCVRYQQNICEWHVLKRGKFNIRPYCNKVQHNASKIYHSWNGGGNGLVSTHAWDTFTELVSRLSVCWYNLELISSARHRYYCCKCEHKMGILEWFQNKCVKCTFNHNFINVLLLIYHCKLIYINTFVFV